MVLAGRVLIPVRARDWGREWRLYPLGDIHLGASGCDEQLLDTTIAAIRDDPLALCIGMGDYVDLISMRDERRFDPEMISAQHRSAYFKAYGPQMRDAMIAKLRPIEGKVLGLLHGNHEWAYSNRFEQEIGRDIATALGTRFLGYSCFIDLVFQRRGGRPQQRFRIVAHHGAGYAQTKGGKLNRLERFMLDFEADIYLFGHVHARLDDEAVALGANRTCRKLVEHRKVGVVTGTYLRTYHARADGASGYGERKQYRPVPLGGPCVKIVPATRTLSIEKP